jgi:hypothetical protein
MQSNTMIPGDRLVLGLLSAFRTLVLELSKAGAIDHREFVAVLEQTAEAHRGSGDANNLAGAIHAIAEQIATSVPSPKSNAN